MGLICCDHASDSITSSNRIMEQKTLYYTTITTDDKINVTHNVRQTAWWSLLMGDRNGSPRTGSVRTTHLPRRIK